MPEILIAIDAEAENSGELIPASPAITPMVSALTQAISASPFAPPAPVRLISASSLSQPAIASALSAGEALLCPLTLNLPDTVSFPAQRIYQTCRDVPQLRRHVEQLGYATGAGEYWLPAVLTAKGPLYGEVISKPDYCSSQIASETEIAGGDKINSIAGNGKIYRQPAHVSDSWRQQLYELAYRLLRSLDAPPATYLVQFGFLGERICFDRLWPYPAAPAVASIGVQDPDLFSCHWYCLTGRPILDLTIPHSAEYEQHS
jgi:hypothetical protein